MAVPLLLAGLFLLIAILWLCMGSGSVAPPKLYFNDSPFNHSILSHCPMLLSSYIPTWFWGKSGHVQTVIYGKMGRVNTPLPRGKRFQEVLSDGATMSYDVFEPLNKLPNGEDCTLLMCPGIANSSESAYILTCVHYAQEAGFRCAVLNHLGALADVPLTSPRIYTYGGTDEYSVMVDRMMSRNTSSQFIAVGFSMGANIVIKYLGENETLQKRFIGAMSCCQGYDALEAAPFLLSWQGGRYLYIRAMTAHQKCLLRRHRDVLFSASSTELYGQFNEDRIFGATTMLDIDEHYSHRRAGFKTWQDYYNWSSSRFYINNVHIPVLLLNALDDPLVPLELHYIPREFTMKRDNVIFAVTRHGGHLGYFEGGAFIPNTITWLDRLVVEFCTALLHTVNTQSQLTEQNSATRLTAHSKPLQPGECDPPTRLSENISLTRNGVCLRDRTNSSAAEHAQYHNGTQYHNGSQYCGGATSVVPCLAGSNSDVDKAVKSRVTNNTHGDDGVQDSEIISAGTQSTADYSMPAENELVLSDNDIVTLTTDTNGTMQPYSAGTPSAAVVHIVPEIGSQCPVVSNCDISTSM